MSDNLQSPQKDSKPVSDSAENNSTSSDDCAAVEQAPLLNTWKTSVGFSLLGAFVGLPLTMAVLHLFSMLPSMGIAFIISSVTGTAALADTIIQALITPIAAIIFYILSMVYAGKFYPSYFSEKPKLKSNRAISFLNIVFGVVLFGVLWNRRLTEKEKGKSHTVLVFLTAFALFFMVVSVGSTIGQGLSYAQPNANLSEARPHPDTSVQEAASNSSTKNSDTRLYIDNETGATFVVPSSWTEAPLNKERDFIDVKFFIGEQGDEESAVMYGSYDFWNSLSDAERAEYKPSDFNSDLLAKSELAEFYGVATSELEEVVYGDTKFQKYTPGEHDGSNLTMIVMFRINNGYVYQLQFWGQDQHYGAFESMLSSMKFE